MHLVVSRALARIFLGCLCVVSLVPAAAAQVASLVADISPGRSSSFASQPDDMWTFKGKVIFAATEPSSGRELWITDGTGSGTRMLADFLPGAGSSDPRILGTTGSLLYGIAFQDDSCCATPSRAYLWRSDGTREGTFLLLDPLSGAFLHVNGDSLDRGEVPPSLALASDGAYFLACTNAAGCSLRRTDGTVEGTEILRQFPGSDFNHRIELTLAQGRLFFTINLNQLWTSDGTPEGTVLVRENQSTFPRRLAALGRKVLFLLAAGAPTGEELWVSDGTAAGTRAVTNFEVLRPFEQTHFLKALDDKIYFVANDATHGAELWASDGTPAGTVQVTDFGFHDPFNGPDNSSGQGLLASELTKLANRLIFWASDGLTRFQPWSSQGTFGSLTPLCPSCGFFQESTVFVPLNGKLVFHAEDEPHGTEVWATDGTAAGTKLLKDACPGFCSSSPPTLLAGAVFWWQGFFSPTLWTSDGTPQGTRRFTDLPEKRKAVTFQPDQSMAALGNRVLFAAGELFVSDGTPQGTRQVTAIDQSGLPAEIAELVSAGDQVFFTAGERPLQRNLWRSAGTAADTHKSPKPVFEDFGRSSRLFLAGGKVFFIQEDYPYDNQLWRVTNDGQILQLTSFPAPHEISHAVSFQNQLFFAVVRSLSLPIEIWKSDGTPQGTTKALEVPPSLRRLQFLRAAGSGLWFRADRIDGPSGFQIWYTDGTAAGIHAVVDPFHQPSVDPEFTQVGSQVCFVASAGSPGESEVWRSDGTEAGTVRITDFSADGLFENDPAELTSLGGNLYFFADVSESRRGLWRVDGTPGSAVLVKDFVRPQTLPSGEIPRSGLATLGNRLLFAADDGVHGREPWLSDGTTGGTALLRDVNPGFGGSGVTGFREAAGKLYFSATDGAHGFELWRTDGTPEGTRLVQDIAPQGASSFPAGFTVAGNRLFFSADDGLTGNELWALPLSGPACQPSATTLCLNGGRFRVETRWRVPPDSFGEGGSEGVGQAAPLSADTGTFWFFDPANVETILKVLDGQGVNGHFWVFYGALSDVEYTLTVTDTQTGLAHRYFNSQGQLASVGDTQAFGPQGVHETKLAAAGTGAPRFVSERFDAAAATGTCVPNADRLCLNGGRFAVAATWKDFTNRTGSGTAVPLTGDTGYFWFFNADNVEAVVKVLDGTGVNGRHWLFYGALSNVEYTLTVTDTMTGQVKTYKNPLGDFGSVADTRAF